MACIGGGTTLASPTLPPHIWGASRTDFITWRIRNLPSYHLPAALTPCQLFCAPCSGWISPPPALISCPGGPSHAPVLRRLQRMRHTHWTRAAKGWVKAVFLNLCAAKLPGPLMPPIYRQTLPWISNLLALASFVGCVGFAESHCVTIW